MSVKQRKKNKQRQYKSNLRRISIVVTAQTDYHLERLCAMNGWGAKDKGWVVTSLSPPTRPQWEVINVRNNNRSYRRCGIHSLYRSVSDNVPQGKIKAGEPQLSCTVKEW